MSATRSPYPNLEQLRKQAKDLREDHAAGSDEAAKRVKAHVGRLGDLGVEDILAAARGLVIGLEEHPGFAGTVAKMAKILARIPDPRFGVAFDMKNTLREGEDPAVILAKKEVLDRVL